MGGIQTIDVRLDAAHAGWRLDRALADAVPTLSRERLKALIRSGSVIATSETAALVDEVRHAVVGQVLARLELAAPPPPLLLLTLRCWVAACEGAMLTWLQERTLSRGSLVPWLSGQLVAMITATAEHDPGVAGLLPLLEPAQPSSA